MAEYDSQLKNAAEKLCTSEKFYEELVENLECQIAQLQQENQAMREVM